MEATSSAYGRRLAHWYDIAMDLCVANFLSLTVVRGDFHCHGIVSPDPKVSASSVKSPCFFWFSMQLTTIILMISAFIGRAVAVSGTLSTELAQLLTRGPIQAICCDVDGTLTSKDHKVAERSIKAISGILDETNIQFIPATGRTRASMARVTLNEVPKLFGGLERTPGVYQQGLQVYGIDGDIIFERYLSRTIVVRVSDFCDMQGLSVVAYCGDTLYADALTEHTDTLQIYKDNAAMVPLTGVRGLPSETTHKMIIINNDATKISSIRRALEEALKGTGAVITQAAKEMLEILPPESSKGDGVLKLLEHLSIDPEATIAFGDGENDIEMFQNVGRSIAVKNARPALKNIASAVCPSSCNLGVAMCLEEILRVSRCQQGDGPPRSRLRL